MTKLHAQDNLATMPDWSLTKKIAFRFIFCFFMLSILTHYHWIVPFSDFLFKYSDEFVHKIIPWVGNHLFLISYDITLNDGDSSDTTFDFVLLAIIFVASILGTILWTFLDGKRKNYATLFYWFTVVIRFYVGLTLVHYGLIKVIKAQFPYPDFFDLTQKLGDFNPERSAWIFFGHSYGYNLLMGMAELAASFLLFRRSMIFGAIITSMVTINVVAVNCFYDVPVKLLSSTLAIMTLFLLLTQAKELTTFFFTENSVALPVIKAPDIKRKWLRVGKMVLKTIIIGYVLINETKGAVDRREQRGDGFPKSTLRGLYNVDTFIINNDTLPPLTTDSVRWNKLIIDWEDQWAIRYMVEDSARWYATKLDTVSKTMNFTHWGDTTLRWSFSYTRSQPDKLNLTGVIQKDSVSISMTKSKKKFKLTSRDFRWVIDYQSFY